MLYSRVIVPLDGSEFAESALPLALALCRKTGAAPVLVTVVQAPPSAWRQRPLVTAVAGRSSETSPERPAAGPAHPGGETHSRQEAERYLERVQVVARATDDRVTGEITEGDPASEIIRLARGTRADVIVMATRGRSGLVRGLLGSVTDRVTLGSPVPVLIVRAENAPHSAEEAGEIATVVLPLDGSELAETALPHTATVAEGFGAKVVLLTVLAPGVSRHESAEAAEYLDRVAVRLRLQVREVLPRVMSGDPRAEIVALAHTERQPVVVMTTRGASGLSRWVRGSVADGVARTASVPTMVVPPVGPLFGPAIH